jgi:hypothetical protein
LSQAFTRTEPALQARCSDCSAVPTGARPEVLEQFRDGLYNIERTLAEVDACAPTTTEKVEGYAVQLKLLKQWMTAQHAQWPALRADRAAHQALGQTLARLEAGATGLAGLAPPSTPRRASAEAAYKVGFKAAALLAVKLKRRADVLALNELVEVLCVAADAFAACTAGQPPCGDDLGQLQVLRDALAGCRLDARLLLGLLDAPQKKALETSLRQLGIAALGRSSPRVRIMLPTVPE